MIKIAELVEGMENIRLLAYVVQAYQFHTKKGDIATRLILQDASGKINGFSNKITTSPQAGSVILAIANVGNYNGQKTVYITEILDIKSVDELNDNQRQHLFPTLDGEIFEKLKEQLNRLITQMSDRQLAKLCRAVFFPEEYIPDPDLVRILKKIYTRPGGARIHHARIRGLFEHTVSVATITDKLADTYGPIILRDIAVAGALLHDIGKVLEQGPFPGSEWTREGELIGHIVLGIELLNRILNYIDVDEEKVLAIKHIILSHHGEKEKGSPVEPLTPEALIVSAADNLDAHLDSVLSIYPERGKKGQTQNPFSKRVFYYNLGGDDQ
jgi:3'-5' exoribonuclease